MSKTVVITGGIGSGKSLACDVLRRRGIPVYDCDSAAKALYRKNPSLAALVTDDIFTDSGSLDRLESALFPLLMKDFLSWKNGYADCGIVGFESATILDKPYFDRFGDFVAYIDAPEDVRFKRVLSRGGISEESLRQRMLLQKDHSKSDRVDRVIVNDSTSEKLELQIIDLINFILDNGKGKN